MIIFLIIVFTMFFFALVICCSDLEVKIKDLKINTSTRKKLEGYTLVVSLRLFNELKWTLFKINEKMVDESKVYRKIQNKVIQRITKNSQNIDFRLLGDSVKENVKIKELYLYSTVGLSDVVATSFLVSISAVIISIILAKVTDKINNNMYYYKIEPVYSNRNILSIYLTCTFGIRLLQFIGPVKKHKYWKKVP